MQSSKVGRRFLVTFFFFFFFINSACHLATGIFWNMEKHCFLVTSD